MYVTLTLAAASPASAHHIWLEKDGNAARLFFGEFGANLREASPGLLDKIVPTVRIDGANKPALRAEKTAGGYAISGSIGAGESVVADDPRYAASERKSGEVVTRSIYYPAARLIPDRAPRAATMPLDVVPGTTADTFKVVFKQQPLADAKVTVTSSSGWARDFKTGADGVMTAALPWKGTYMLEVMHVDKTPGKRGEDAYDQMTYVMSLTLAETKGPDAPMGPPPAPPNK
jgi:hypothetical protein